MADDKTKRGSPDNKRLNKSEAYETKYARSKRASPARKAMAGASGSARSGTGAKKTAAKKTAAKKTAAKKGGSSRKSPARSGAGKSASRGGAKSASPAMKRTNAAPLPGGRTPSQRGTPHPPKEEKTIENTAPKTMREPDAIDLLTDDHLAVSALFKKYEKLAKKDAGADERRALAQIICTMLRAHTRMEEEIFYPAARSAGIDADQLDEARIEHASAKDLIARIEIGNPADDLYDARVTVLGEYIQHHVVEEHTEMFPKCRRADMDLVALRSDLEARKMSILPDGGDGAAVQDGAGKTAESPSLLAKLGDKLFSSESSADKRGRASTSRS